MSYKRGDQVQAFQVQGNWEDATVIEWVPASGRGPNAQVPFVKVDPSGAPGNEETVPACFVRPKPPSNAQVISEVRGEPAVFDISLGADRGSGARICRFSVALRNPMRPEAHQLTFDITMDGRGDGSVKTFINVVTPAGDLQENFTCEDTCPNPNCGVDRYGDAWDHAANLAAAFSAGLRQMHSKGMSWSEAFEYVVSDYEKVASEVSLQTLHTLFPSGSPVRAGGEESVGVVIQKLRALLGQQYS